MEELDDVVKEFLVESHENLDQLERDLVALEETPDSSEAIARIFRTIHTIKGTCGFLGFFTLEKVAHVGENLLSRLRDGKLALNGERTNALLALVDAIRGMLTEIESTNREGDADYSDLVTLIAHLQEPNATVASLPPPAAGSPKVDFGRGEPPQTQAQQAAAVVAPAAEVKAPTAASAPEPAPQHEPVPVAPVAPIILHEEAQLRSPVERDAVPPALDVDGGRTALIAERRRDDPDAAGSSIADTTIRVDVGQLDKLMNLVGELVLARNQILQFTATVNDASFLATTQRLNLVTTELQEGVMKTRMQPIETVWGKFPRVVRDVARQCGKLVRIEMEGRETELDKTIIEAIKDPLTHIVRNSVDHGIEAPDERARIGKRAEGKLSLRAYHEGGHVNIEILDDGRGIDPVKIKKKAIGRGLVSEARANQMTDREITNMIFMPGFSTAEKVTAVSGRGVGMDVVKTNIERIGGTVDIQSSPGNGTTLRIKIPLTLAIIPALVVRCGGDRYAIPQVSLVELVRLEGDRAEQGIEFIHGVPIYRLRGNLLPVVDLRETLYKQPTPLTMGEDDVINIVVLQADDRQFGLIVDDIQDTEEIVVKPLSKQLKNVGVYAGATIMGDGRVALILDVLGMAQRSRVVTETRDRMMGDREAHKIDGIQERETLLLVRYGDDRTMAIPLELVSRLEEVQLSTVERAGPHEVVQYRGQIMPLIHLGKAIPNSGRSTREQGDTVPVVVFNERGRSVGVVVDYIDDIVEDIVTPHPIAKRPGVRGAAVVQGRVVELLDVAGVIGGMVA